MGQVKFGRASPTRPIDDPYIKAQTPRLVHMARLLKDQLGRAKHIRLSSLASLMTSLVYGRMRFHEKLVHPHNCLDGRALYEIWKKYRESHP